MIATTLSLAGKRVLIVEDELLVALLLEEFVLDFDCEPAKVCSNVAEALEAVEGNAFDLAILDVNLKGERSYPVAEVLSERAIPFFFLSGYGADAIPPDRPHWKLCNKPFTQAAIAKMMSAALDRFG